MKEFITHLKSQHIPDDKKKHFYVGCALGSLVAINVWFLLVATFIAIGKEYYDFNNAEGNAEVEDIVYTFAGSFVGSTIVLLIHAL